MNWRVKKFSDLSTKQLFEIYKLRAQVFVVEQNCIYQDVDDVDLDAYHVLGIKDSLAAYARIYKKGKEVHIGRVVVRQDLRNQKLGKDLMKYCLKHCSEELSGFPIAISAQQYLLSFYNGLGFVAEGDGYLEDGIPHVRMVLLKTRPHLQR